MLDVKPTQLNSTRSRLASEDGQMIPGRGAGVTIETAEADKKRLLAEISQEVGNPDWVKFLRDHTLVPFGEDMTDFVDLVGIPYMERYTSDEKWIMESLMVLLIGMEVNRIKDPTGSFKPTSRQNTIKYIPSDSVYRQKTMKSLHISLLHELLLRVTLSRQNTISSILMMTRLMCRIHQEMNDTTFPEQGEVGSALVQTVLIGDMVAGTYLRAAANMDAPKVRLCVLWQFCQACLLIGDKVAGTYLRAAANMDAPKPSLVAGTYLRAPVIMDAPKVTEVLMGAASYLQSYFVPKLHPYSIEGGVEQHSKACSKAAAPYDHLRDDMPAPLMAACEAVVIDSGLGQRLQDIVKNFAYHISLARSLNKGLDVNPDGQPTSVDLTAPEDAKAHSDKALNSLLALSYPESRSIKMLKRLARVYAAV
ncbi:hypothetical protein EGW08_008372 [Elysia chlorotica]|uniref:Uncharacterized protein n=1 Tax=Elysia chlorotica TaxID=188477 RepID=A0A3S1HQ09_ELYCH|nr:hypothetical protein EGW08_008372 [Elysia chlorotica]